MYFYLCICTTTCDGLEISSHPYAGILETCLHWQPKHRSQVQSPLWCLECLWGLESPALTNWRCLVTFSAAGEVDSKTDGMLSGRPPEMMYAGFGWSF